MVKIPSINSRGGKFTYKTEAIHQKRLGCMLGRRQRSFRAQQVINMKKSLGVSLGVSIGSSGRSSAGDGGGADDDDETSKTAIASYQAREEEIERRKLEVRGRVESQLSRAEEEAKRLTQVWAELEELTDPTRKEVSNVRRRLELATRDLKSLQQICQKKEKEYKEAMEAFQEKSNERSQLTTALMELLNESEKFRMKKLEELSKIANSKAGN